MRPPQPHTAPTGPRAGSEHGPELDACWTRQNSLHDALLRFITAGRRPGGSGWEALWPSLAVRTRAASGLSDTYAGLDEACSAPQGAAQRFSIPPYQGDNACVRAAMAYLERHLAGDLAGAYVHGSLGSGEAIPYSDFDALVILSDAVLRSSERLVRAADRLREAQRFMFEHDALQHHGWFVLTEYDLNHYCDAYFPAVLFGYARSLLPGQGEALELYPRPSHREVRSAFDGTSASVLRLLRSQRPARLYPLKSLLSQFMLLPALYVHVRDGKGVWKADSFDRCRTDFEAEDWAAMEAVSAIRVQWRQPEPRLFRLLVTSPTAVGHLFRKRCSPRIPAPLASRLEAGLYAQMEQLAEQMRTRAQAFNGPDRSLEQ